jgi:molybdopterin-synthase adenylyltransferase
MNRLALLQPDVYELSELLLAASREDGCFMLLREGRGRDGRRLVATDPMLPGPDDWEVQEGDRLRPTAQWVSAVVSRAVQARAGLLFIHTHPHPSHPIGFSRLDVDAISSLGEAIGPILDGPFGAAVFGPHGWAAALASGGHLLDVDRVVGVGRTVRVLSPMPAVAGKATSPLDDRQRDALGDVHDLLGHLHVALVGVGGLGSPIAEQLVRMGIGRLTIVDDDVLDGPSNLRRVFGATVADLNASTPPAKVDVVGRHLDVIGLGTVIARVKGDVRNEEVMSRLVDADVVVCATDTHGSRAAINDLVSALFLPAIDVGVQGGAKRSGSLAALVAEVRVLTPVTPCLWCRGVISADVVRVENLPHDQRERLTAEGYLVGGLSQPAPSVVALTVLGAGLAACALLSLLSEEASVVPSGYVIDGFMGDALEAPLTDPLPNCRCRQRLGLGL